jgi:adenylate cyclase
LESLNLNKELRKEILVSEKLRAILLTVVSVVAIFILLFIKIFFSLELEKHFKHIEYVYLIQIVFLFFVVREIIVIKYINKKLNAGEDVKDRFRYITNFIEVSIPSIILITIGSFLETTEVLISPVIFLYFIIIILSTLSLEFKISMSIGLIAAIEYLIIFFILNAEFEQITDNIIYNSFLFHIGKANLLILGGVIAGLVAEQIKKKMIRVNKTLSERNKLVNMFGQQISSSIVDYLIENDNQIKSERKYVCLMFLDIRGFTPFAESKEPEEIIKYQNDVFGFMIEIINKHHGVINQFLGDGYMATFGAPLSSEIDSQNAVNASLEIIEELKRKNENKEFSETKIGIGLHSGYVVAGNVGTDIRKQYSISGNTVILASRIEQLNKTYNSQLLISQEVFDNIKISEMELIKHGKVHIKGREEPIGIYQLK